VDDFKTRILIINGDIFIPELISIKSNYLSINCNYNIPDLLPMSFIPDSDLLSSNLNKFYHINGINLNLVFWQYSS